MRFNRTQVFWATMLQFNYLVLLVSLLISLQISRSQQRDGDHHECLRPCADEASSKKICHFVFFVSELPASVGNESKIKDEPISHGETAKGFLGINGKSPGPRIEVCLGDTIDVLLYNRLGSEELSFHWHGLRQKNSPYMDGVPMVTQCSILPYGGFRYKIKPESVGTHLYYAHLVSQQGDGVYGSLTVRGPQDDPSLERILLLSSRPPTPLSWHSHLHPPTLGELLLNGQSNGTVVEVNHGMQHVLRLVNANAYNCPLRFSVSGHDFRVSAADGNAVRFATGRHIVLFPGERFDVTIEANQPAGKYLIDMKGFQDCQHLRQKAFLLYDNAKPDSAATRDQELFKMNDDAITNKGYDCHEGSTNVICGLDLKGSSEPLTDINVDEIIYVPFDVHTFSSFTDEMTDNRYNLYGCAFYPTYLSSLKEGISVAQINRMSFKYPSSPLLSQAEKTPEESICSLESRSSDCVDTPLYCECVQIIEVPSEKNIEIILIDEGLGSNTSHTFHIHGYNASIVGRGSFDQPITREEVMFLDRHGKLDRNYIDPPQKDSFVVPNKGYIILRLFTDNLGYWLWEARSSAISAGTFGPSMQFLLKVGDRENFIPVPLNFPTCGNNKSPDQAFETN